MASEGIGLGRCPIPAGCVRPAAFSSADKRATTVSSTAASAVEAGLPGAHIRRKKRALHFILVIKIVSIISLSAAKTVHSSILIVAGEHSSTSLSLVSSRYLLVGPAEASLVVAAASAGKRLAPAKMATATGETAVTPLRAWREQSSVA